MTKRSRPLMIAPFIPLLGIVGIFGLDGLHGSRFLVPFVVVWCVLLAALFAYVLSKALDARKKKLSH